MLITRGSQVRSLQGALFSPTQRPKRVNDWITTALITKDLESHPRYVNCETIYCFSDASFNAWAFEMRGTDFSLLFARGGLVKKGFTIPRAELTAVYFAFLDLDNLDLKRLGVKRIILLTDNEPNVHLVLLSLETSGITPRVVIRYKYEDYNWNFLLGCMVLLFISTPCIYLLSVYLFIITFRITCNMCKNIIEETVVTISSCIQKGFTTSLRKSNLMVEGQRHCRLVAPPSRLVLARRALRLSMR